MKLTKRGQRLFTVVAYFITLVLCALAGTGLSFIYDK